MHVSNNKSIYIDIPAGLADVSSLASLPFLSLVIEQANKRHVQTRHCNHSNLTHFRKGFDKDSFLPRCQNTRVHASIGKAINN